MASVQEEETLAGAFTSAYQIRPTIAIALDMTFGKGTGANDYTAFPIGKGVTLGIGPSIHPFLHKRFKEVAERVEIPVKDEPMPEFFNRRRRHAVDRRRHPDDGGRHPCKIHAHARGSGGVERHSARRSFARRVRRFA